MTTMPRRGGAPRAPLRMSARLSIAINAERGSAEFELDGRWQAQVWRNSRPGEEQYMVLISDEQASRVVLNMLDALQLCMLALHRQLDTAVALPMETLAALADAGEGG